MATIATIREYLGLQGTPWLEFKHGDTFPVQMCLKDDDGNPIDLTDWQVVLHGEHVVLGVAQTEAPSLTSGGSIRINDINLAVDAAGVELPDTAINAIKHPDQASAGTRGVVNFILPPTPQSNPLYNEVASLPGMIIWIKLTKGDATNSMPFGVYYRRGSP